MVALPRRLDGNDGTCMGSEGQHVVSWRDANMHTRHPAMEICVALKSIETLETANLKAAAPAADLFDSIFFENLVPRPQDYFVQVWIAIPCRMPASTHLELSSGAESLKFDDFTLMCMFSCSTRRHVLLLNTKACLLAGQETMFSS